MVGSIYAVKTNNDASRLADAQTGLKERNQADPASVCREPSTENVDFCRDLDETVALQKRHRNIRDVAFVATGVIGLATIATVFLWKPRANGIGVTPTLSASSSGLLVYGSF